MVTVRRITSFAALLLTMSFGLWLAPVAAQADTVEVDDIVFTFDPGNPDAGARATSYNGPGGELALPPAITVDGVTYAVTEVGYAVFASAGLTAVTIPRSVQHIAAHAFDGNQLTSIAIPGGVQQIGEYAFTENQLTSVAIPDSVTSMAQNVFYDNALTSIDIGSGMTSIPAATFGKNELTSVTIPDWITTIGNGAFAENRLTSIDLGSGVTTIGEGGFYDNALTGLDLPPSVTSIGTRAFMNNSISSLEIPDTVTSIGMAGFQSNHLTSLAIGSGLHTISSHAFRANQLTSVTIPATVTGIDQNAFTDVPLVEATFLGPAPTVVPAGPEGSFGPNHLPLMRYLPEFDASVDPGGFTHPKWHGYQTAMVGSPSISGPATATFTVGTPSTWAPDSLTGDPSPTVTASGLPEGLDIDPATGVISGTALDTAGDYEVSVTASNDRLPDATLQVTISVLPGAVSALTLTASNLAPDQGDTITVSATGADAFGNDLGDLTDSITFTSDVATDVVDGNAITFPHASPHVITATHPATGTTATLQVEVQADPVQPPVDDPPVDDPPDETDEGDEQPDTATPDDTNTNQADPAPTAALPDTGLSAAAGPLLALGSALLVGGAFMLFRSRRGRA